MPHQKAPGASAPPVEVDELIARFGRFQTYSRRTHEDDARVVVRRRPLVSLNDALVVQLRQALRLARAAGCHHTLVSTLELDGDTALFIAPRIDRRLVRLALGETLDACAFVDLALDITRALAELHEHGLLHGNLKPSNIMRRAGKIQLIDMRPPGLLSDYLQQLRTHYVRSRVLPYLAPEQSERGACEVDRRADLYALGASFYELLTGQPPFTDDDPLVLLHAHLSRAPVPLARWRPDLPAPVSDIVMRLLVKDPRQRYQSAGGLVLDLKHCRADFTRGRAPVPFSLGRSELRGRLELDESIHGRRRALALSRQALDVCCAGRTTVLTFGGEAGSGKSALVAQVGREARDRSCRFVVAHCTGQRPQPWLLLRRLLVEIAHLLEGERPAELERWRRRFAQRCGREGGALAQLCPRFGGLAALEHSEPHPSSPTLQAELAALLDSLATSERPLVVVLEDLQWADVESLSAFEACARYPSSPLLLLLTGCRDQLDERHDPRVLVESLRAAGLTLLECELGPLDVEAIQSLLVALLAQPATELLELADAIALKTFGNPGLVRELLAELEANGLLHFEPSEGWCWSTAELMALAPRGDALKNYAHWLSFLAEDARSILGRAALVGERCPLALLSDVVASPRTELLAWLQPALDAGFVVVEGEMLCFTHSEVLEATLQSLDPDTRAHGHLALAESLARGTKAGVDDFELLRHLSAAHALLPPTARRELVERDLGLAQELEAAGELERAGVLLEAALVCCDAPASSLLRAELELELAGLCLRTHELARARLLLEGRLADEAKPRLRTCVLCLRLAIEGGRLSEGLEHLFTGLATLDGEAFELSAAPLSVRQLRDLITIAPPSPDQALALELLALGLSVAQSVRPWAQRGLAELALRRSLAHGSTAHSAVAIAHFALLYAANDPSGETCDTLLELATCLSARFQAPAQAERVAYFRARVAHRRQPFALIIEPALHTLPNNALAQERALLDLIHSFLAGTALDVLRERCREHHFTSQPSHTQLELFDAGLAHLCGGLRLAPRGAGDEQPESELLRSSFASLTTLLEGDDVRAREELHRSAALAPSLLDHPLLTLTLVLRAVTDDDPKSAARMGLDALAARCPVNYRGWQLLALAAGEHEAPPWVLAQRHAEACAAAGQTGIAYLEALAHRRAAQHWLNHDQPTYAGVHFEQAIYALRRWGAKGLADELSMATRALFARARTYEAPPIGAELYAMIRASQALSRELNRHRLIACLLETLAAVAGADHGALVTVRETGLYLVAGIRGGSVTLLPDLELDDGGWLCPEFVRQVHHGKQPLALDDLSCEPRYASTVEALDRRPRSVLCAPIEYGDSFRGVFYLENSLTPGLFSIADLELLEIFVAQAAITHEIATAYLRSQEAEQTARAREEDLRITLDSIGDAVIATDAQGRVARLNRAAEALLELPRACVMGAPLREQLALHDGDGAVLDIVELTLARLTTVDLPPDCTQRAEATLRPVSGRGAPINAPAEGDAPVGVVIVLRDETERRRLQAELLHSQKLEALGKLVSSVSHDFNNMLGSILGAVGMLELDLEDRGISLGPSVEHTELIKSAVASASGLTQQLLAFGRKRPLKRVSLDLHEMVATTVKLISHLVNTNIELGHTLDATRHELLGDTAQLQNALLNLGINARDAMAEAGGALHFTTRNVQLDVEACARSPFELTPGTYIEVEVRDEGAGMSNEVRAKIFEPFFTTKVEGKGTGLGLAAVHRAVTAHRGEITVRSTVGIGTAFSVRLPLA